MPDDFEVGGENEMEFLPYSTFLNQSTQTKNVTTFQRDYVMHEVTDAHRRASARRAFVVKVYIYICINFF